MSKRSGKSSKNSRDLETRKLVRDKFALLAMVGRVKKEVSPLHEEADFYSSFVTEQVALSADLLDLLQEIEQQVNSPETSEIVADLTSQYHRSIRQLLNFWPPHTESQERYLSLLASDGLEKVLATTPDGYVSLSTDRILKNVERVIEATKKELNQKQSSNSTTETA